MGLVRLRLEMTGKVDGYDDKEGWLIVSKSRDEKIQRVNNLGSVNRQ
jgi:hypothetical protein